MNTEKKITLVKGEMKVSQSIIKNLNLNLKKDGITIEQKRVTWKLRNEETIKLRLARTNLKSLKLEFDRQKRLLKSVIVGQEINFLYRGRTHKGIVRKVNKSTITIESYLFFKYEYKNLDAGLRRINLENVFTENYACLFAA